ncbi:MAG TPA: hypothetical protein VKQ36_11735 [Ktedonobacterales bacterium]|nr:hypothetical protein [Ktedonobacterales bacterium]
MADIAQTETSWRTTLWPADVIHVNEDGWVAFNRGLAHGVTVGMRLLVIGSGVREMRDLFNGSPKPGEDSGEKPVILRTRRTYELLEVVFAEQNSAIAVATRAPLERRPEFYRGPEGELLVWVPLPKDYTWPPPESSDEDPATDNENTQQDAGAYLPASDAESDDNTGLADVSETSDSSSDDEIDEPDQHITQEDERWEEALPLNGVSVGDRVLPAIPATPGATSTVSISAAPVASSASMVPVAEDATTTGDTGATHETANDWRKPLV